MKKIGLIFILFLTLNSYAQSSKTISVDEFKKGISGKNIQLIDVRTPDEYRAGHIKNAQNIDYMASDFKVQISKFDKTKPVYIYCQKGGRSASAAKIMKDLGFKKIFELKDGYSAWKE